MITLNALALLAASSQSVPDSPAVWRQLVLVGTRVEVLGGPSEVRAQRFSLEATDLEVLRSELQVLEQRLEESNRGLDIQFDLSVESAPLRRWQFAPPVWDSDPARTLVETHFNDAPFDSDDPTFRGPYQGVFWIDPQPGIWLGSPVRFRFGTPLTILSATPAHTVPWSTALERLLRQQVMLRGGTGTPEWLTVVENRGPTDPASRQFSAPGWPDWTPSNGVGVFSNLKRVDTERGEGWEVTISDALRAGNVTLEAVHGFPGPGSVLEFSVQSALSDPIVLSLGGQSLSLGPVNPFLWGRVIPSPPSVRVLRGEGWQTIRWALQEGQAPLQLSFPDAVAYQQLNQFGPATLRLAGFRWTTASEPPTPFLPGIPAFDPAQAETLARDEASPLRLTALHHLGTRAAPNSALAPLWIGLARSADPGLARLALAALVRIETPEATGALNYAIAVGPFEHNRFAAVEALARAELTERNRHAIRGLGSMLTATEWPTRELAVRAMARLTPAETGIPILAFIRDREPAVRLAVCEVLNPESELATRRLLFLAVNDPVESVRIAAYATLLRATAPEMRAEALKGVRDESPRVRAEVTAALATLKRASDKHAALVAAADRDPRVRLVAVRALLALGANREEAANLLQDPDSVVQSAARLAWGSE